LRLQRGISSALIKHGAAPDERGGTPATKPAKAESNQKVDRDELREGPYGTAEFDAPQPEGRLLQNQRHAGANEQARIPSERDQRRY